MQYNTNILKLQIIYSLKDNFPERMKHMLDSSFQEHCLQPQNEVTEWLNMYCEIFQNFVESHREGLWQEAAEYWINIELRIKGPLSRTRVSPNKTSHKVG
jgi:hypothetical protein